MLTRITICLILYCSVMKIDKRELLEKLSQTNLWQNLSAEEVRLYLLLIISADEIRGVGRLSPEVLERCLGSNLI